MDQLRVGILQNGQLVEQHTFPLSRPVTVGSSPHNDVCLPISWAQDRFALFRRHEGRLVVVVSRTMEGRISAAGDEMLSLREVVTGPGVSLQADGSWLVPLSPGARGRIEVASNAALLFKVGVPGAAHSGAWPILPAPARPRRRLGFPLVGLGIVAGLVLVALWLGVRGRAEEAPGEATTGARDAGQGTDAERGQVPSRRPTGDALAHPVGDALVVDGAVSGPASKEGGASPRFVSGAARQGRARVVGAIKQSQVLAELRRRKRSVQRCYLEGLRQHPGSRGRMTMVLSIDASGAVARVGFPVDTLQLPSVASCIRSSARFWSFPRPMHGMATVEIPFVLVPSE